MVNVFRCCVQELEELADGANPKLYFPVSQIVQECETAINILGALGVEVDPTLKGKFREVVGHFTVQILNRYNGVPSRPPTVRG